MVDNASVGQAYVPPKEWEWYSIGVTLFGLSLFVLPKIDPAFKEMPVGVTWISRAVGFTIIGEGLRPKPSFAPFSDSPSSPYPKPFRQSYPPSTTKGWLSSLPLTQKEMPTTDKAKKNFCFCVTFGIDHDLINTGIGKKKGFQTWWSSLIKQQNPKIDLNNKRERTYRMHALRVKVATDCDVPKILFDDFVSIFRLDHDTLVEAACQIGVSKEEEEEEDFGSNTGLDAIIDEIKPKFHKILANKMIENLNSKTSPEKQWLLPAAEKLINEVEDLNELGSDWKLLLPQKYLDLGIYRELQGIYRDLQKLQELQKEIDPQEICKEKMNTIEDQWPLQSCPSDAMVNIKKKDNKIDYNKAIEQLAKQVTDAWKSNSKTA